MLFQRLAKRSNSAKHRSVYSCRQKVLQEVIRTHLQPRKSLKRQKVRRSKIATLAQHSRAALVAQFCIVELEVNSDCRYHARVHFSCSICIATAFQLLPLFIFSRILFILVYSSPRRASTRT